MHSQMSTHRIASHKQSYMLTICAFIDVHSDCLRAALLSTMFVQGAQAGLTAQMLDELTFDYPDEELMQYNT